MPPSFISVGDFDDACERLERAFIKCPTHDFELRICSQPAGRFLSIKRMVRCVRVASDDKADHSDAEAILTDGDEEVADGLDEATIYDPIRQERNCAVVYDILLSPSYRVPALYFYFSGLPMKGPKGLDAVYQYLVPWTSASQLQAVGTMGGISMTNHPLTGMPCFFVHPCNTAEAMHSIVDTRQVSNLQFLQIWIGLIGASVGLYLPKELAIET